MAKVRAEVKYKVLVSMEVPNHLLDDQDKLDEYLADEAFGDLSSASVEVNVWEVEG